MRRKDDGSVRITSASKPRSEDIRGRERRYLISMGLRAACFLLAVATMGHWVMWLFLVGAVFLPYVAVVLANAEDGGTRSCLSINWPEPTRKGSNADLAGLPTVAAITRARLAAVDARLGGGFSECPWPAPAP